MTAGTVAPDISAIGRHGAYTLGSRLAAGGMAEVFAAEVRRRDGSVEPVVVKRPLSNVLDNDRMSAMFVTEARLLARMLHPNICRTFEPLEIDGRLCLAMERLFGLTFSKLSRIFWDNPAGPSPSLVTGILCQIADGLHYAHELRGANGERLGTVHRDVSPANVFVTWSGVAKLLDFGVAKSSDTRVRTRTGHLRGTLSYMAPEQLRAEPVDRRADVFSLGVLMFEALTGRHLFRRESEYLTFLAREHPVPDPRHYRPEVPAALAAAVQRALDTDASRRFSTARQLAGAVSRAMESHGGVATPPEIAMAIERVVPEDVRRANGWVPPAPVLPRPVQRAAAPTVAEPRPWERRVYGVLLGAVVGIAVAIAAVLVQRTTVDEPLAGEAPIEVATVPRTEPSPPAAAEVPASRAVDAAGATALGTDTSARRPRRASKRSSRAAKRQRERRERRRERREEDADGKGIAHITIDAKPFAAIEIDGKRVGNSPVVLAEVAAGRHTVRAIWPDGREVRTKVRVRAGETARKRLTPPE